MRRLTSCFGFTWVVCTASVAAQNDSAAAPHPCDKQTGATKSVCRAGYDAIMVITPIGALAVGRGNPSMGSAGGGQKFGDMLVTLRANYLTAAVPATSYAGDGDTVPVAQRLTVLVPSVDLRMNLLSKPLPMGAASVDFLLSLAAIAKAGIDYARFGNDVRSVSGVAIGIGYGVRIGVTPKGPLPTASLNVGRSDLPRFTVGNLAAGSNFSYTLGVSAINARLMVGRRFGHFELTAGGGADLIKGDYSYVYLDQATKKAVPRADSTVSTMRLLTVVNTAFHLAGGARLSFEGGFQVGKNDKLPTIFGETNTKSGRFFGGVGLGFKL